MTTMTTTSNFGDAIPVQRHSFWRDCHATTPVRDEGRCAIDVGQERMDTRHQKRSGDESQTRGSSLQPRSRRGMMVQRARSSRSSPRTSTAPGSTSPSLGSAVHAGAVRSGRSSTTSTTSWSVGRCPSCRGWSPQKVAGRGRIPYAVDTAELEQSAGQSRNSQP